MAEKQLIVVVEGTSALGPYWQTIRSDYLDKIIRCFCRNEISGQKLSGETPEFALVVFNTHGPYSAFTLQRTGWTKNVDVFYQWLSGIPFSGGGFCEAAVAEGLSEALMMLPTSSTIKGHQNLDIQKHCILVAASNPHPLPTPVYQPPISSLEQNDSTEVQPDNHLADAETVAKCFGQCSLSLSVISPKPLPKLRAIYNAGKRMPRAAEPSVEQVKNPHFLVLLSENFMEALAALNHPSVGNLATNQNGIKMDGASATSIPASSSTAAPSANGSMINRPTVPIGNIPTATVKMEPTAVSSMISGPGFSHISSLSSVASQGVPSLQTSSPSPTPQEMNVTSEGMQDLKPIVNNISPLRPVGPAPANVSILNNISQHRQMVNSASISGANSMGLQTMGGSAMAMHMSNMISSGMASTAMSAITSIAGSAAVMATAQSTGLSSFGSGTSNLPGNLNTGISPTLSNPQGSIGMGQSVSSMGQGPLASGSQVGQSGISINQNIVNSIVPTGMSSGLGTMMPTPGMSQSGVHSLGGTNSSMNMPLAHAPGVQQSQSKYVKIWEGNLSGQRQGQPVFICKLEGYRNASASETLAADWPASMQIVRLIAQDHMNNKQYVGKADFLVFRTLNQHGFLGQLQEKKLCAVILLPSQTLLMSVSDKAGRLIGMLFPGDMVVFKPQVSSQQQQQLQQTQQHQHLQQQQQHLQQQQQLHFQQQQQQHAQLQQQTQQQQQMVGSGMSPQQLQMVGSGMTPPQQQQQMINSGMAPQQQQMFSSGMTPQQQQMISSGMTPQQQTSGSGMTQQQQMLGSGMSHTFGQGPGRSQIMSQVKMPSQGPGNMTGGGFLP